GGAGRRPAPADRRGARPLRRDEPPERQEAGPGGRPRAAARRAAAHARRAPPGPGALGVALPLRLLAPVAPRLDVPATLRQPVRRGHLLPAEVRPAPRHPEVRDRAVDRSAVGEEPGAVVARGHADPEGPRRRPGQAVPAAGG